MLNVSQRLHCIEYGEQSSDSTVVVLHGLLGSAKNLAGICRHLSQYFRVIAFDLPNHGQSPHVDQMSISGMAEQLIDEISSRGLLSTLLLGHSLGGKVAMAIALKQPALVEKLVVADIAPVKYKATHRVILDAMLSLPVYVKSRGAATEHMAQRIEDAQTVQFLMQNLQKINDKYYWRCNVVGLANSYEQLRAGLSAAEFPGIYSRQALFIKGAESDYIRDEHVDSIMALFPASSIKSIEGAGHWLHVEKPQAFNRLVEAFFS